MQTVVKTLTVNRMSLETPINWEALDDSGSVFDLTGYSFHMWWGVLDTTYPGGLRIVQHNPVGGLSWTSPSIAFSISEADLLAVGAGAGSHVFEILASNDGGVTTLKPFSGTFTVPSFLTLTY